MCSKNWVMGSNYKKLGPYVQIVNERNSSLLDHKLLGVSIKKCFMPSIANIVGTDMSTYKLIRKKQFAYGPVTSRNGDKISIAILDDNDEAIVSQAYTVFEIIDHNELDPEYLMMWFRRPEFDRYARFKSHGSAREIFDWSEMCEVELPIPSIEKQREIVREYNTIVNRISLNERLIQKLEETAQAIYKRWFVEFDFPSESLAKDGVSQPYKSSGGKMVWCEELEREIPEGWVYSKIGDEIETLGGGTPSTEIEEYWLNGNILWYSPTDLTNNNSIYIFDSSNKISDSGLTKSSAKLFPPNSLMMTSRATIGKLAINLSEATTNQGFITMIPTLELNVYYLFCWIKTRIEDLLNLASGSTFLEISKSDFRNLYILIPEGSTNIYFKSKVETIFKLIKEKSFEDKKLKDIKGLLLSKMATVRETMDK